MTDEQPKRILAVASGGGHWIQLRRLMPAFQEHEVIYAATLRSCAEEVSGHRFFRVPDANRHRKLALAWVALSVALILLRVRPDVVISTGAAPGFFAIRLGKLIGCRTIWIDSLANAEQLSLSGRRIGPHADLWLTQWPHLATPDGPHYVGAVL